MKKCCTCKNEKSFDNFYRSRNGVGGVHHRCKECTKALSSKHYFSNKNSYLEKQKEYRKKNRKKYLGDLREAKLRRQYGMTLKDYDNMVIEQLGSCAICNEPNVTKRNMHIDHCHKTGRIRGLLCSKCNQAIGLFRDSEQNMLNAIYYLKRIR